MVKYIVNGDSLRSFDIFHNSQFFYKYMWRVQLEFTTKACLGPYHVLMMKVFCENNDFCPRYFYRKCSIKRGFLKNFAEACNFIKKTLAQVLFCKFCEAFKNIIFTKHLWETASEFSKTSIFSKQINFFQTQIWMSL